MSRVFSREEFYELVWSKPMTHLAKEFALSDVALHKICRKHGIPNPPLGWWAKKAAGKKVSKMPLPRATKGSARQITIARGELRGEDEAIMSVREEARVRASSAPRANIQPSPLIERTIAKLRKAKLGPNGLVSVEGNGLIKCAVAPGSIERLAVILNEVVATSAQQGFDLAAEGEEARFVSDAERVSFSVTEVVKRVKHELTDKELAEEERWTRKRERASLRNEWSEIFFSRPQFPEWDYLPTGQLSFELEHVYVWNGQSPRRSFRDGKVQRLEAMASDIAVGLAVLAAAKTAHRLRQEAEQGRIKEERRLRELELRSRHIEERRTDALQAILAEVEKIERFRRLLETLRQSTGDIADLRVAEFMQWAEAASRYGKLRWLPRA